MSIAPGTSTLYLAGVRNPSSAGTYFVHAHLRRMAFTAQLAVRAAPMEPPAPNRTCLPCLSAAVRLDQIVEAEVLRVVRRQILEETRHVRRAEAGRIVVAGSGSEAGQSGARPEERVGAEDDVVEILAVVVLVARQRPELCRRDAERAAAALAAHLVRERDDRRPLRCTRARRRRRRAGRPGRRQPRRRTPRCTRRRAPPASSYPSGRVAEGRAEDGARCAAAALPPGEDRGQELVPRLLAAVVAPVPEPGGVGSPIVPPTESTNGLDAG